MECELEEMPRQPLPLWTWEVSHGTSAAALLRRSLKVEGVAFCSDEGQVTVSSSPTSLLGSPLIAADSVLGTRVSAWSYLAEEPRAPHLDLASATVLLCQLSTPLRVAELLGI